MAQNPDPRPSLSNRDYPLDEFKLPDRLLADFAVLVDALDGSDSGVECAITLAGEDVDRRLEIALHLEESLLGSRFRGNDEGREKRLYRVEGGL
jgi:hypothetical protein